MCSNIKLYIYPYIYIYKQIYRKCSAKHFAKMPLAAQVLESERPAEAFLEMILPGASREGYPLQVPGAWILTHTMI